MLEAARLMASAFWRQGGKGRKAAAGSDDDSDEDFGVKRKAPKKKAAPKKAEVSAATCWHEGGLQKPV